MDELPSAGMLAEMFLLGLGVPTAVALAVLGLGVRFSKSVRQARAAGALALAGGFFAGYVALRSEPLVPQYPWHWLPYLALLAGMAALVDGPGVGLTVRNVALGGAVAVVTAWLLVPAHVEPQGTRVAWLLGTALAVLVLWIALDRLTAARAGPLPMVLLAVVAAAAGFVLVQAQIAKFAQLGGALAATLGAHALIAWRSPSASVRGAAPGVAVLLPGLLLSGVHYTSSDVPLASFLLVAASPLFLALSAALPLAGWRSVLLQTAATAAPVALAVVLAVLAQ
jgi:hypothetical protein